MTAAAGSMGYRRDVSPGVRWRDAMLLAAALWAVPASTLAQAQAPVQARVDAAELRSEIAERAGSDLRAFYRGRGYRPLWISREGSLGPAGKVLLELVQTSEFDALNPRKLRSRQLAAALRRAEQAPTPDRLGRAEIALSRTLAAYVQAMRQARRAPMIYVNPELAPVAPTSAAALKAAAAAPSLAQYVEDLGWMHPLYGQLRRAAVSADADPLRRDVLLKNLARLRAIPAEPASRYVLVDAAGARLWMYENGRVVDTMKVVVGKTDNQTPMIAGYLRTAILNPYWNVPADLARSTVAPNVLAKGFGYLKAGGYQVMSDWTDAATVLEPGKVDWQAVASGAEELRVRQLPGPANFMGKVKFEFPNDLGIYLHDTPDKNLMRKDERQFSSGCVRLEDAQRFGRWLLRKPLPRRVAGVERRVGLPEVVPVYITYLTAMPVNGRVTFNPDPYSRDGTALALGGRASRASR